MTRVLLLNDTAISTTHFGCQLVMGTIREQLARVGLQLTLSLPNKVTLEEIRSLRHMFDIVIVNGEGTIHHGRAPHLVEVAKEYPAFLINCVYEDNPRHDGLGAFRLVTARESMSAGYIRRQGVECEVVPDLIFASSALLAYANRHQASGHRAGLIALGETDNSRRERWTIGSLSIVRPRPAPKPESFGTVQSYLDYLARHQRLCVGRFHAVCACAVLGIPFASYEANTWKIQGIMRDMGAARLHFPTRKAALKAAASATVEPSVTTYAMSATSKITALFDRIAAAASV